MKEFIVNLDHTTRQQIPILVHTEEEAAMLLRDIILGTDLLDHFPIVSKGSKIICGNVKLALPVIHMVPLGEDFEDEEIGD